MRADGGGAAHRMSRSGASSGDEYSDFDDGDSGSGDGSEAERIVAPLGIEAPLGFESDSDAEDGVRDRSRSTVPAEDHSCSVDSLPEREATVGVWAVLAKRVRGQARERRASGGGGVPSAVSKKLIAALRTRNVASGASARTRSVRSDVSAALARYIAERTAATAAASAAAAALESAVGSHPWVRAAAAAEAARRVRVPRAVIERLSARNVVEHGHDPFKHLHALRGELQEHERLARDVVLRHGLRELAARVDRQNENADRNAHAQGAALRVARKSSEALPLAPRCTVDELRARKATLEPWELELLAIDARADQLYARIAGRPEELAEEEAAGASAEIGSASAPTPPTLLTATSAALLMKVATTFAGDDAFPLLPKRRPVDGLDSRTPAAPFALKGIALGNARC